MGIQQIVGVVLLAVVLILYVSWLRIMKNRKGVVAKNKDGEQVFDVLVKGVYAPDTLRAKVDQPVRINFLRQESTDCSRFVNFPDFKIRKELPEGKTVTVGFTPNKKGEFLFTCDMSMYRGRIIVE